MVGLKVGQSKANNYNIWLSFCAHPLSFFLSSPWPYTFLLSVIHWLDGISSLHLYMYLPPKASSSNHIPDYLVHFWLFSPTHFCLPCFSTLLHFSTPPTLAPLPLPIHTLNFGESASAGTGMMMSTLLAVERFLNCPFAWREKEKGKEEERGGKEWKRGRQ